MVRSAGRSAIVALMLCLGGWLAAGSAQASSVVPSLEWTGFTGFQQGLNVCNYGGAAFLAEIDSGFTANQSDCYTLSIQGVGQVSRPYCENGPFPSGPFPDYGVAANNVIFSVPAGTPAVAEVRSYNGPNGTGSLSFTSRITFTCDSGKVLDITSFAGSCQSGPSTLCLANNRFAVSATYAAPNGAAGTAQVVPLTADTGYLWFFSSANVEAVIKVINGCALDTNFWVFAGGLTNVKTVISVTDTATGVTKKYTNPQGQAFQPIQDTSAFATCGTKTRSDSGDDAAAQPEEPAAANVATSLLLNNNRFKVDVIWRTTDGKSGSGTPVALTNDTGYFWFFESSNVEMVIKVLSACALDGKYWVFAGGLTNVHTTVTVTDTKTGKFKTYVNPQGVSFQPVQDTAAFSTCP
ncbi:MAG TPA: hypothetical protein VHG32_13090 [Thermoanaerobaculia bacterium]|nr:hypothetical protein [Thermoanaerobaculia bacterium]